MKSNMSAKFISYTLYLYKNVKYFLVTLEMALDMTHNIFYLSKTNKQEKALSILSQSKMDLFQSKIKIHNFIYG